MKPSGSGSASTHKLPFHRTPDAKSLASGTMPIRSPRPPSSSAESADDRAGNGIKRTTVLVYRRRLIQKGYVSPCLPSNGPPTPVGDLASFPCLFRFALQNKAHTDTVEYEALTET